MKCTNCGQELLENALFCNECGKRIKYQCSNCKNINFNTDKYCQFCGDINRFNEEYINSLNKNNKEENNNTNDLENKIIEEKEEIVIIEKKPKDLRFIGTLIALAILLFGYLFLLIGILGNVYVASYKFDSTTYSISTNISYYFGDIFENYRSSATAYYDVDVFFKGILPELIITVLIYYITAIMIFVSLIFTIKSVINAINNKTNIEYTFPIICITLVLLHLFMTGLMYNYTSEENNVISISPGFGPIFLMIGVSIILDSYVFYNIYNSIIDKNKNVKSLLSSIFKNVSLIFLTVSLFYLEGEIIAGRYGNNKLDVSPFTAILAGNVINATDGSYPNYYIIAVIGLILLGLGYILLSSSYLLIKKYIINVSINACGIISIITSFIFILNSIEMTDDVGASYFLSIKSILFIVSIFIYISLMIAYIIMEKINKNSNIEII